MSLNEFILELQYVGLFFVNFNINDNHMVIRYF